MLSPLNNNRVDPSKNIIAVLVDVHGEAGAMSIFDAQKKDFVDKVGPIKGAGNIILVRSEDDWWFSTFGYVRTAYFE